MAQRVVIAMALAVAAVAADPGRADHRARRDRRGRGARPGRGPAPGVRHLGAVHQPQPGGDRQDVRPGRRAVRRRAGRGRARARRCSTTRATRTRSGCCAASRGAGQRKDADRLDTIPGFLPTPGHILTGCIFAPRCALAARSLPAEAPPPFFEVGELHDVALLLPRAGAGPARGPPRRRSACSAAAGTGEPLVVVDGLSKTFTRASIRALAGVDLSIRQGETLGLVGESGSGKTTLARVLLGLTAPDQGSVVTLRGQPLSPDARRRPRETLREALQIVFQNPDSALNRRHTVRSLISRPLARLAGLSGARLRDRLADLIASVRLEERHLALRPEPAVRRAQAARRDRPRVRRRPRSGGLRRADLGARRVGPGGDPQPAGRPAEGRAGHLPVHLPRPRPGPVPVRPHRGAVPRPGDGGRAGRDGVRRTAPPLHRGAVLRRAVARRRASGADHGWRARSRPRPTRPAAACSTPAARGGCLPASARSTEPPLLEAEPGHQIRCHIPLAELRELQQRNPSRPARKARQEAASERPRRNTGRTSRVA